MHLREPTEEDTIDALRHPGIWPVRTRSVEVVRTHFARVFLTDEHAFKMKRPVVWHDVDLTSVESRRAACEREVALNRPLAGEVYQGTIALRQTDDGTLSFAAEGRPVEWLVQMRRLPAACALDHRIERGRVDSRDVDRIAESLAAFYSRSSPVEHDPVRHLARLARSIDADLQTLREGVDGVPGAIVDAIAHEQREFLGRRAELLADRVREGRVVEAHGDLRPEHVYLLERPVVIDRLELDGDLRMLDALSDLVFLALECERLGAPQVGVRVIARYCAITGDTADPGLVRFYRIQHACTRAKLAVWHLGDPGPRGAEAWAAKARDYLRRASQPYEIEQPERRSHG